MRTTVTLDEDVVKLVRDAMHRTRRSFKETLNAAIREGLAGKSSARRRRGFAVKARPLGLRAGIDPAGFNRLVDDLEAEAFLQKARQPR